LGIVNVGNVASMGNSRVLFNALRSLVIIMLFVAPRPSFGEIACKELGKSESVSRIIKAVPTEGLLKSIPSKVFRISKIVFNTSLYIVAWKIDWVAGVLATPVILDVIDSRAKFLSEATIRKMQEAKKAFAVVSIAAFSYLAVDKPHLVFLPIEHLFSTEDSKAQAQDSLIATKEAELELRQKIFDSWRESFKHTNDGRYPDPVIDKEVWDRNWYLAFEAPMGKLKAN
jgi:hypothetical protein